METLSHPSRPLKKTEENFSKHEEEMWDIMGHGETLTGRRGTFVCVGDDGVKLDGACVASGLEVDEGGRTGLRRRVEEGGRGWVKGRVKEVRGGKFLGF